MAEILRLPGQPTEEWVQVDVVLPPPSPRIPPGTYQAVSIKLTREEAFRRLNGRLEFDIFDGPAEHGAVLARLPFFFRWPAKKKTLAPNSKLARLLYVAGIRPDRHRRISLDVLRHKLWRVEVGDAEKDSMGLDLMASSTYSVVKCVVEKLT